MSIYLSVNTFKLLPFFVPACFGAFSCCVFSSSTILPVLAACAASLAAFSFAAFSSGESPRESNKAVDITGFGGGGGGGGGPFPAATAGGGAGGGGGFFPAAAAAGGGAGGAGAIVGAGGAGAIVGAGFGGTGDFTNSFNCSSI